MVAESDDQYPGDLRGRKLYIPQMSRAGARLVAASLRARVRPRRYSPSAARRHFDDKENVA